MMQGEAALERLAGFCRDLEQLKAALDVSETLERAAESLAVFFSGAVPLRRFALVRISSQGAYQECAVWEEGCPQNSPLKKIYEGIAGRYLPQLRQAFLTRDEVSGQELEALVEQRREVLPLAALLLPLWSGSSLLGFAFFVRKKEGDCWKPQETELLKSALTLVSARFSTKESLETNELQSWVFNAMMDNMQANLYVTDIATDHILFMNKTMKKTFGVENPEGKVCWQVLQKNMDHRCDFCPVRGLIQSGEENPTCMWEEKNTLTERVYENYDSLMRWMDGAVVHFQHSVDITEKKRLAWLAARDELTDMHNRRAGKEKLAGTLKRAGHANMPVSIAMYDLNRLKDVNDTYGHSEGDILITSVARTVKKALEPEDYCFRLSGDEFVVVFYNKTEQDAAASMRGILVKLAEKRVRQHKPYEMGFCFGVTEVTPGERVDVTELLVRVDQLMYEQKRQPRPCSESAPAPVGAFVKKEKSTGAKTPFSYDKDRLLDCLVPSTDDYIYVSNMKTGVFRYPKSMVDEFGLPGEVVENAAQVWGEKVHEHDRPAFLESNREIMSGATDTHCVEYRARNKRGEWVWLRCRGHMERDENGEPSLFAGIITNLGKKNKIDHLTGLFNKYEFQEQLTDWLESAVGDRIGVILLGLDDFKHINDLYDREFGDEVIRITLQKIQSLLPGGASVFRMDGDEFGVLFPGASRAELFHFYASVRDNLKHQQEYNGQKYYCTVSAGCSFYPDDGKGYLELYKYAGCSLNYSKTHGKNRLTFYSEDILEEKARELELIELLRESVENGFRGFEVYFQPQVNAATGRLEGAEALTRWRCEKYGEIPPSVFIPLLEESGLIVPAGKWIFEQAAFACKEWAKQFPRFTMSINLSCLQLNEPGFVGFLEHTLKWLKLSPKNIMVELTESYIASGVESIRTLFSEIRGFGVRIAMDDFGTGYSSLGILKDLPVDVVKIDRAFVKDIRRSTFDATFIRFVVALCHDVGIEVCLEGVEETEEYETIKPMQLDEIQGFLFGRPMPRAKFEQKFFAPCGG